MIIIKIELEEKGSERVDVNKLALDGIHLWDFMNTVP
jgi:hypothetical protein